MARLSTLASKAGPPTMSRITSTPRLSVAFAPPRPAFAHGAHLAGELHARGDLGAGAQVARLGDLAAIEAAGAHAHLHLPRLHGGDRHVAQLHAAAFGLRNDADRLHCDA